AIAKRIEEGLAQVQASLALFPGTIELVLQDYELHKAGKKRLAELLVGFLDDLEDDVPVPAAPPVKDEKEDKDDDADSDDDSDDDDDDSTADEGPTGPDPAEVEARFENLTSLFAKFEKAYAKHGPSHKSVVKLREDMAEIFVTLKLPLPLTDTLVRNLRGTVAEVKRHERRILEL